MAANNPTIEDSLMPTAVSVFGVKPFRIGGTETFARELSLQLHERGWRSVLCFSCEPTDEVRKFLSGPNVSFEVLQHASKVSWHSIRTLRQIVRRHKAQLLHLHFTGFLGFYPWAARLQSVKRIFFTDHSSRPTGYVPSRAPFIKRIVSRALNNPLTKVISVSQYGEHCLTTLDLLPRQRHELVYNAVDLSRVKRNAGLGKQFRERHGIPKDRIVVVQVSWMIPEKGVPELLGVAAELIKQKPNVHFVLVGEGEHRQRFMQHAEQLGLSENVTFTGLVADPFGEGVYEAADIVCQLSAWEELFGWMIAEAMAYGKPIVATRVGGIPELVKDGLSGFLVKRGDVPATVEAFAQLSESLELRKRMGDAGAAIVREKFDLKQNVQKLLHLYGLSS
ncbi:MAG TPA: glycosyltransferase family 4 protein [Pyrinomonadaceae bacterium]